MESRPRSLAGSLLVDCWGFSEPPQIVASCRLFRVKFRCRSSALLSGLGLAAQLKHATTSSSEVPCPRNLAHLQ